MPAIEDVPAAAPQEPTPEPYELAYHQPADLAGVRALASRAARELGLPQVRADLLVIAVSELATNTLQHTGAGGLLRLWATAGRVYCEITDQGAARAFGRVMPAADAVRGRGLAIVERVCDEVTVVTGADGTKVRLAFDL
jgi:serine/threonine-protein kinase RsbW